MKPIILSTEMVKAILKEQKTQIRRVVKDGANRTPQNIGREKFYKMVNTLNNKPFFGAGFYKDSDVFECKGEILTDAVYFKCPYKPGDILWVRETWAWLPHWNCESDEAGYCRGCTKIYKGEHGCFIYKENMPDWEDGWCSPIHMPRDAARLFLRMTNVRVERLQDITEDEAIKEGAKAYGQNNCSGTSARIAFAEIWDKTTTEYEWRTNPWVWVYEFEKISRTGGE